MKWNTMLSFYIIIWGQTCHIGNDIVLIWPDSAICNGASLLASNRYAVACVIWWLVKITLFYVNTVRSIKILFYQYHKNLFTNSAWSDARVSLVCTNSTVTMPRLHNMSATQTLFSASLFLERKLAFSWWRVAGSDNWEAIHFAKSNKHYVRCRFCPSRFALREWMEI